MKDLTVEALGVTILSGKRYAPDIVFGKGEREAVPAHQFGFFLSKFILVFHEMIKRSKIGFTLFPGDPCKSAIIAKRPKVRIMDDLLPVIGLNTLFPFIKQ